MRRHDFVRILCMVCVIAVSGSLPALAGAGEKESFDGAQDGYGRPNIILIMTDDMGHETVGAHGSLDYKTPNLDKLAAQGILFNNCHSQPLCTPSRVKIMTGRYAYRNYEKFGLLPTTEVTFGKQMQEAGYLTCMVGKWQLGGDHATPNNFGFDEYCLLNGIKPAGEFDKTGRGNNRYFGYPMMVANGKLYESKKTFGPDMVNEYAVNFIKKKKDKPFFMYYPMIAPHSPWSPSPFSKDGDKSGANVSEVKYFKDMIEYIDHLVGNVVKALEESGQRENTLIMFTGDNGTGYPVKVTAPSENIRRVVSTAGRLDGKVVDAGVKSEKGKSGVYLEGPVTRTDHGEIPGGKDLMTDAGTHVPLVVDWPRYAKEYKKFGNKCDDLIDFSDFFATAIELGEGKLPSDREIDGISFANRLRGEGAHKREYIFCHYWGFGRNPEEARDAIHDCKWKLYNNGNLFDLRNDILEQNPLMGDALSGEAKAAKERLMKAYKELRNMQIPNDSPSKKKLPAKAPKKKKTKKTKNK